MAQPQGLNVPAIITSGVVGTLLIMAVVEGVRAYNNVYTADEEARKWEEVRYRAQENLRAEQKKNLTANTSLPIGDAMKQVVASGGKRPTTQPNK
jgi:hypothetical protein